jgi:RimJ/RimL family protein N-acetyltransferase
MHVEGEWEAVTLADVRDNVRRLREEHGAAEAMGVLLRGRRVRLRALTEEDYPLLYRWVCDLSEAYLWRGRRAIVNYAEFCAEQHEKMPFEVGHMLIEGATSGEPLGWIFAYDLAPFEGSCFLTIYTTPRGRRFGAGAEATLLFLSYLFTYFSLNKVAVEIFEYNTTSLALTRRLGFAEEARLRRHWKFDGEYYDVFRLSLLREEWEAARTRYGVGRLVSPARLMRRPQPPVNGKAD